MKKNNTKLNGYIKASLILIPLLCAFVFFFSPPSNNSKWKIGQHYKLAKQGSASQSNQVVLYFSPACPHCYEFDTFFDPWYEEHKNKVVFERIPVQFDRQQWEFLAKIYAVARVHSKQDLIVSEIFERIHEKKMFWGSEEQVIDWLVSMGIPDAHATWYNEQTSVLLKSYSNSEKRYQVRSIPMLLVNGLWIVNLDKFSPEEDTPELRAKALQEITELIDYLFTLKNE